MLFKSIKSLLLAGAMAFVGLHAEAANDQNVVIDTNYAGWDIWLDRVNGNCTMSRKHTDGTVAMYGFNRDMGGWWLAFGQHNWRMTPGREFDAVVVIDGHRWDVRYVVGDDGNVAMSNGTLKLSFMREIAMAQRVDIYGSAGKWITALRLDGTYDGLGRVVACQEQQGWEPREQRRQQPQPDYRSERQPKSYTY